MHASLVVALAVSAGATASGFAQPLQNATAGAAQQAQGSSDLEITRNIRRALMRDKSLSIGAHNVTIITRDGKVTLKGHVASGAEKQTVETTAGGIAGAQNVQSQLSASQ